MSTIQFPPSKAKRRQPPNTGNELIQRLVILSVDTPAIQRLRLRLSEKLACHGDIEIETDVQHLEKTDARDLLLLIDCEVITLASLCHRLQWLHKQLPEASVALINVDIGSEQEAQIEWPNVDGLFYRGMGQRPLLLGLNALINRQPWLPPHLLYPLLKTLRKPPHQNRITRRLTRRESEILTLLCDGASNQDIATHLHVSNHTIKSHMYNIFKKLQVNNRVQACRWAQTYLR